MPKIVDVNERRASIARASWRVVARSGIAGLTTRELALEAGVSSGVLFHYFRDKDEIICAAFDELVETFRVHMRAQIAPARTSLERLRLIALSNLPLSADRADEFSVWLSMWAQMYSSPTLRLRVQEFYQNAREILANVVADVIADGHFRDDVDAEVAAAQIIALTDGFIAHLLIDPEHPRVSELAVASVNDLFERWSATPSPAPSQHDHERATT